MVRHRKAMALVAHSLEQVQRLGLARDAHRLGTARHEHLLELLGEGAHRDLLAEPHLVEHRSRHAELSLAAIHDQQLGRVGEAALLGWRQITLGQVVPQPPAQHLIHGRVVIVAIDIAKPEVPVLAAARQTILEHHHRTDVVGSLQVAHVVALDAQRRPWQLQVLGQLVQRPSPAVVVAAATHPVPCERFACVVPCCVHQRALVAPLRDAQRHPGTTLLAQPLFVQR